MDDLGVDVLGGLNVGMERGCERDGGCEWEWMLIGFKSESIWMRGLVKVGGE